MRQVVVEPRLPTIRAELLEHCQDVTDIPHADLDQDDLVRLHGEDRRRLGNCKAKDDALIKAVRVIVGPKSRKPGKPG